MNLRWYVLIYNNQHILQTRFVFADVSDTSEDEAIHALFHKKTNVSSARQRTLDLLRLLAFCSSVDRQNGHKISHQQRFKKKSKLLILFCIFANSSEL